MNQQPKPIMIRIKLTRLMQYRLTLIWSGSLLMLLGILFFTIDINNPLSIFYGNTFVYLVLGAFVWWFGFALIRNAKIVPATKRIVSKDVEPNNNIQVPKEIYVANDSPIDNKETTRVDEHRPSLNGLSLSYIVIWAGIIIFQMLCIWSLDVCVSSMGIINAFGGAEAVVNNGFYTRSLIQQYHLSLYGLIVSTLCLCFVSFKMVTHGLKKKERQRLPMISIKNNWKPMASLAGQVLGMTFLIWFGIWLAVAGFSNDYTVVNKFNVYGEYHMEVVLFAIMAGIMLVGLYVRLKGFRRELKRK